MNAAHPATVLSNFQTIARGGLSDEYRFLTCYSDFTAGEYVLGNGPPTLTIAYDRQGEERSYELYVLAHELGEFGDEALLSRGEYEDEMEFRLSTTEAVLNVLFESRESVVMLAPMGAHNAIAVEAWQAVEQWDLQTDDDDVVQAVRYGVPEGDPEHTQTLSNLKTRITTAAAADAHATTRIANVSGLTQYYRDMGAYGDITPGDGSTATFTPAQPPQAYSCASGTVVTSPGVNLGLVHDCEALIDGKDGLRGTGTLNWSTSTAIGSWDGVTTAGSPTRVTKLELDDESLTGTIPAGLGSLFELTHLDLSRNSLTGDIPAELGWLHNLQEVRLSGNSLTGCIPLALRSVATNDLSSLNLPYCRPPAPGMPTAGAAGEASVPLTWTAGSNTSKYRVEYRESGPGYWTVDDETITGTSHTVDGLQCETAYQFRLSAFGSGTAYGAAWSDPSSWASAPTGTCVAPEFAQDPYTFSVAEDAEVDDAVGTVTATDNDPVTYAIATGNEDETFAMNEETGAITVTAALDYEGTRSYSLMVEATDGGGRTATATVTITVTDVVEDPPTAPTGLSATLADDTFTLSWTAVTGAAKYEAQVTTDAADAATVTWTALPEVATLTTTYSLTDGLACGTAYRFRVRAYGDGDTYTAMWGTESAAETVTTAACNRAPEFVGAPYAFSVGEDAALGHIFGTVSATDPDRDVLMYTITGTAFAIDPGSGAITVAGALDHETTPSYRQAVTADDLKGGTATATVTVAVTDVAEDPPTAPTGLDATLAVETFTITWAAVSGAARYEAQVTADAADAATVTWTALPEVTATTTSHAPTGGPACGTTYRFRVRAYGDGNTYAEVWGPESGAESVTTASCNQPPTLGASTYDFFIRDTTAADSAVGSVAATDADTGDALTYAIAAGNDAGKFAIDSGTGRLTVAGTTAFNLAATPYYALTVEASDGNGGTATARVRVSLTIAACHNGTVVPRPDEFTRLVRDCSVLLTAKDTLRGTANLDWSADTPIRQWQGIYTGWLNRRVSLDVATIHVTDVIVSRIGLNGSVASVLAGLVDLHRLDLDDNALTGEIPAALGQLEYLELLHLLGNRLTGSIPTELGNLSNLRILSLYANDLTGAIPAELGKLTRLEQLLLDDNDFTGELPSELANITGLKRLYVRESRLTGAIPAWLADLDALEHLFLEGNEFTGCIPAGLRDVETHDLDRLELTDCTAREEDSSYPAHGRLTGPTAHAPRPATTPCRPGRYPTAQQPVTFAC